MFYRSIVSTLVIACAMSASFAQSTTSSSVSVQSSASASPAGGSQRSEITLRGTRGVAQVAGDKVELKDSVVYVNGVSYGPVPQGAEVRYVVTEKGRTLLVGGEIRSAAK